MLRPDSVGGETMKRVMADLYVRRSNTKAWAYEVVWRTETDLWALHSFPFLDNCRSVLGWDYGIRTPVR
jgi:hypothetical protein